MKKMFIIADEEKQAKKYSHFGSLLINIVKYIEQMFGFL